MNVLCVDDEYLILEMMIRNCRILCPNECVTGFDDALEALEYARKEQIDIALLDIDMPGMNGIQLSRRLRELNPKTNIIMVTAYPQYALDAYAMDCSGYLLKPVSIEELRHQLDVLRFPVKAEQKQQNCEIVIRCFGPFEIFIDDEPMMFRYTKTKELLALLIDSRGALCSYPYLVEKLWTDEKEHSEYFKSLRKDLVMCFSDIGSRNVLFTPRGQIGINKACISCDYYDYLDGKGKENYHGEYMTQYLWAEATRKKLRGM